MRTARYTAQLRALAVRADTDNQLGDHDWNKKHRAQGRPRNRSRDRARVRANTTTFLAPDAAWLAGDESGAVAIVRAQYLASAGATTYRWHFTDGRRYTSAASGKHRRPDFADAIALN